MEQLILEIQSPNNYNLSDYVISDSNREAYRYIINSSQIWGISPYENFLLISGPNLSGKTYLAKIWSEMIGAHIVDKDNLPRESNKSIIIEDIDKIKEEEKLLHFFNNRIISDHKTLLTSNLEFSNFKLKDLNSRIRSINRVYIKEPSQEMIGMLITKLFSDKSIKVTNDVLNYLVYRVPRDYHYVNQLVNRIDKEALLLKREITIHLISKILDPEINPHI